MKKVSIAPVVMLVVAPTPTSANDQMHFNNLVEENFNVEAISGLTFKIKAANIFAQSVIEIKDEEGYTLYKEAINVENFEKVYNLSSLPNGKYKIVLSSGDKSIVKPFEIQTETTRVAKAA